MADLNRLLRTRRSAHHERVFLRREIKALHLALQTNVGQRNPGEFVKIIKRLEGEFRAARPRRFQRVPIASDYERALDFMRALREQLLARQSGKPAGGVPRFDALADQKLQLDSASRAHFLPRSRRSSIRRPSTPSSSTRCRSASRASTPINPASPGTGSRSRAPEYFVFIVGRLIAPR